MIPASTDNDRALVLIVDDSVFERAIAHEALADTEFDVIESKDGSGGFTLFKSALPDLVLLDVKMPGMNGFELCSRIRALPEGRHVPVLMMTGLDDVNSIERAYDAGATDFFTKPINPAILRHRIRYLLRAKRTGDALRDSEAKLAHAKRLARLGHWEWNIESSQVHWSQEMELVFGVTLASDCGVYDAMSPFLEKVDAARLVQALELVLRQGEPATIEHSIRRSDGTVRVVQQEIEATGDGAEDTVTRLVGTTQDITERVEAEQRIRHLAFYDPVTELPNRSLLRDHLERSIGLADRDGSIGAVLFLDLDHFKHINDTCGHALGDRFLREVAARLVDCISGLDEVGRRLAPLGIVDSSGRPGHCVARIGGDEFVIMLARLDAPEHAELAADRIQDFLSTPIFLDGRELYAACSVGITAFPNDGRSAEALLRNADMAMYHAKALGRNRFHVYTQELDRQLQQRIELEASLRTAIAEEQFELHYQPRIDVASGEVIGVEALIRWVHPERGVVSPADFIPLAEQTGLIVPLGEWVIRAACRQAGEWHHDGISVGCVSINVSGAQFNNPRLKTMLAGTLSETQAPASMIELELTEGVLMENAEESANLLCELKALGISISIDDFGTGYSSLSYLKRFPIDVLKIDRTFVRDISRDADDAAIVSMTVMLGHALRLLVVAEGVEDEEQLEFLRERGCDGCQGYLFTPALPVSDLEAWLAAYRPAAAGGSRTRIPEVPPRPRLIAT